MPRMTSAGEYINPSAQGPYLESVPVLAPALPASLPAFGGADTYTSNLMSADGFYQIVVALTAARAGMLKVQRYVDDAGTVPINAGDQVTLAAGIGSILTVSDGKPFASYKVIIQNTDAGGASALSGFAILQTAANSGGGGGSTVLAASSAIIGKVGIDQTTPGTTNGVTEVGNTNLATNQISVDTTAGGKLIVAARVGRNSVTAVNHGTTDVFLGPSGVTISTGTLLVGVKGACITLPLAGALYGIVAAGSQTVSYAETY
jgi:hypothetical protein